MDLTCLFGISWAMVMSPVNHNQPGSTLNGTSNTNRTGTCIFKNQYRNADLGTSFYNCIKTAFTNNLPASIGIVLQPPGWSTLKVPTLKILVKCQHYFDAKLDVEESKNLFEKLSSDVTYYPLRNILSKKFFAASKKNPAFRMSEYC